MKRLWLWRAACGALGFAAAAWVALHGAWAGPGRGAALAFSGAAGRAGQRMEVALPKGPVHVNTATADELCGLYGVGPAMAQAIVAEREANGPFRYPEDLRCVKGIGEKKLAGFIGQITLE